MSRRPITNASSSQRPKKNSLQLLAFAKPFHSGGPGVPESFALLGFHDRDGRKQTVVVPASYLVTNPSRLIELLSDRGYAWPDPRLAQKVINELGKSQASHKAVISSVPGWHGDSYVRPHETFRSVGTPHRKIHFVRHSSVKLAPFLEKGTLQRWKRLVAFVGTQSSRARLFIALAFAAIILKPLNGKPFGVILVGGSSTGKTLCIRLGNSVMGHNRGEPLTLKATGTAIEELFLGHRDGFLGLDEVGSVEGGDREVASFFKALSFQTASGQAKNRASSYERSVNAIKPDTRIVLGLTSEVSLAEIAKRAGGQRLRGEELRLIELRAEPDGHRDIFDGEKAEERIGPEGEDRAKAVKRVEAACEANQGVAHCEFLQRFCEDPSAVGKLREWIAEFEVGATDLRTDSSTGRIISSFAIPFAAVRLAISYNILSWNPEATRRDILACLRDALRELSPTEGRNTSAAHLRDKATLVTDFGQRTGSCDIVQLGKGDADESRLAAAEAFNRGNELLVKSEVLQAWYPNPRERKALIEELQ